MLEASALEYEHEQERQLQKALLDSRKEAERRDAEAKEVRVDVIHCQCHRVVDNIVFLASCFGEDGR